MDLLPHLLRGLVSTVMNVVLMLSMLKPRYGKRTTIITMLVVLAIDLGVAIYCYQSKNLSLLTVLDVIIFTVICFAIRPLFSDTLRQWIFSYVTVQNINIMVITLSFIGSRYLPFPIYSNTLLRLVLFSLVIVMLRYRFYPIYRQIAEQKTSFVYISVIILINYIYYFLFCGDTVQMLYTYTMQLLLLTVLSISAYLFIFHMMKSSLREYALYAKNLKADARQELLHTELTAQEDFIYLAKQARHDLRHHNALLLDYLDRGDVDGARDYLRQHNATITQTELKQYCKNTVANAVLHLYARRAEHNNIAYSVNARIPAQLPLSVTEIGELLSNILENACEACERSSSDEPFVTFNANVEGETLMLEICNLSDGCMELNKDGLPRSKKQGGGIGTRSVSSIVKKHGGMLSLKQNNGIFNTRIILPIKQ